MSKEYIISTDDKARDRLELQHSFYRDYSINLLKKTEFRPISKVLEIGCGSGAMTIELANMIGREGELLSIDLVPEQVEATLRRLETYPNVQAKVLDVNNISTLDQRFDVIYCRMVLHHLKTGNQVLSYFDEILNPGGTVILEEPEINSGIFIYPHNSHFEKIFSLIGQCFKKTERDSEACFKMPYELKKLGYEVYSHEVVQPVYTSLEQKKIYLMGLQDFAPQLIENDIASPEDIDRYSKELLDIIQTDNTISGLRMHQVIATKR